MEEKRSKTWLIVVVGVILLIGSIYAVSTINTDKRSKEEQQLAEAEKTATVSVFETNLIELEDEKSFERITFVHNEEKVLRIKSELIRIYKTEKRYKEMKEGMYNLNQSAKDPNVYPVSQFAAHVFNKEKMSHIFITEVTTVKGIKKGSKNIVYSIYKDEEYYTDNPEDIDYQDLIIYADDSTFSEYVAILKQNSEIKQVQ